LYLVAHVCSLAILREKSILGAVILTVEISRIQLLPGQMLVGCVVGLQWVERQS